MLAIMNSAFGAALRWLVTGGGVKMIMVVVIGWLMTAVVSILVPLIPGSAFLQTFADQITPGTMWWINKFRITTGITVVFGSLAGRFLVRRIPFIG